MWNTCTNTDSVLFIHLGCRSLGELPPGKGLLPVSFQSEGTIIHPDLATESVTFQSMCMQERQIHKGRNLYELSWIVGKSEGFYSKMQYSLQRKMSTYLFPVSFYLIWSDFSFSLHSAVVLCLDCNWSIKTFIAQIGGSKRHRYLPQPLMRVLHICLVFVPSFCS